MLSWLREQDAALDLLQSVLGNGRKSLDVLHKTEWYFTNKTNFVSNKDNKFIFWFYICLNVPIKIQLFLIRYSLNKVNDLYTRPVCKVERNSINTVRLHTHILKLELFPTTFNQSIAYRFYATSTRYLYLSLHIIQENKMQKVLLSTFKLVQNPFHNTDSKILSISVYNIKLYLIWLLHSFPWRFSFDLFEKHKSTSCTDFNSKNLVLQQSSLKLV